MSEWRETTLGEALEVRHGFAFKGEHFRDKGDWIVLTPGNFHDQGGFKHKSGKEKYYDGPVPSAYLLSKGDVVVAMTEQTHGLLGSTATVPAGDRYLHNQRLGLLRVADLEKLDLRFCYHLMNAPIVRQQIQATATGSKVRHTAPERIRDVRVRLPDVATQHLAAGILDALDDLIENNRRRVELLEQMAQAIYREWFVHFRYPGHEDAALVDSPLGPIPEGWEVITSSELLAINPRMPLDRTVERPFITMGDLREWSMICFPSEKKAGSSGSRFQNGDTLFARITPCLENGKTGYVHSLLPNEIGRGSTEFIVLRGRRVGPAFTYWLAREDDFRAQAIKSMSGASGRQRVRKECFDSFLTTAPPVPLAENFEQVAGPTLAMAYSLARENQTLAGIRDILLPKLVTGQIDVSGLDLDALTESVA